MSIFVGELTYNIDEKGRVNVPSKFRKATSDEAENKYIISYETDNCLFVYPYDTFVKRVVSRIDELSETDSDHRAYASIVGENATEATMDKQGRIIIPLHMLERVGITKTVKIIGAIYRFELWDPEKREEFKRKLGGPNAKERLEGKIFKNKSKSEEE